MKNPMHEALGFQATTYLKGAVTPKKARLIEDFGFTSRKDDSLMVMTSDEIPLVFYAPVPVLGIAKVSKEKAMDESFKDRLHALFTQFNINPAEVEVYMGPCLTFSHTFVERPVMESLMDRGYRAACKRSEGVDFLDVPVLVLQQLRSMGVLMEHIHISAYDTFENPDCFYSALRGDRDGNPTIAFLK